MDVLIGEEWRAIDEFPGYQVSSRGNVLGLKGNLLSPNRDMLPHVSIKNRDGTIARIAVDRLVAMAFIGPQPPKTKILHLDADERNCCADNLRYATQAEIDARFHKGDREGMLAKLREVKRRWDAGGETYQSLADEFNLPWPWIRAEVEER